MSQTEFYTSREDVSLRVAGEGGVLYSANTRQERRLNPTGLFIWQKLDGTRTLEQIVTELEGSFEGAPRDELARDAASFLSELASQGFAERLPEVAETRRVAPSVAVGEAPSSVELSLTGRCNLRCAYCFYADAMRDRPDLPTAAWLSFFEELGRLAVRKVTLSGGEVFLRRDLFELIDALIAERLRYGILTNGSLITEETVAALSQGLRRVRLDSIQVSLDGSRAEIHEASRGPGSFAGAVRALRLLKEAGFPVTSRITVNRHNLEDLPALARLLFEELGIGHATTNEAVGMGECRRTDEISLSPAQERRAMDLLAELAARYPGRLTATAGPQAKREMFAEMEQARASGKLLPRMGRLTACGCIFEKLAVNHDGTITPCVMLEDLVLGRIGETPIAKVWQEHPVLKELRDRRSIPMTQVEGCEGCEWTAYCNGSCPGLPYALTRRLDRASPADCYRRFLEGQSRAEAEGGRDA